MATSIGGNNQPANPTLPPPPPAVFEEYKLIEESASHVSDRRERTNDVFSAINALFLTGIGITLFNSQFNTWWPAIEAGVVALVVFLINVIWRVTLAYYNRVLRVHYQCLRDIESRFHFEASLSTALAKVPRTYVTGKGVGTGSGVRLARYFLIIYPLITAGVIVVTYLSIRHIIDLPH